MKSKCPKKWLQQEASETSQDVPVKRGFTVNLWFPCFYEEKDTKPFIYCTNVVTTIDSDRRSPDMIGKTVAVSNMMGLQCLSRRYDAYGQRSKLPCSVSGKLDRTRLLLQDVTSTGSCRNHSLTVYFSATNVTVNE